MPMIDMDDQADRVGKAPDTVIDGAEQGREPDEDGADAEDVHPFAFFGFRASCNSAPCGSRSVVIGPPP